MDDEQFKKSIQATFDDVSSRYDENQFFSIAAKKMVELLPFQETMDILDVSTGTGAIAIELANKYHGASIEAIDLSLQMLKIAETKSKHAGFKNILYRQCDVDKMPYQNERFDFVTCGYALFFYPDMVAIYQKICQLIKPGGTFVFSSFTNDAFNPYAKLFLQRIENNYSIQAPTRVRERLKTQQQIEELSATSQIKSVTIEHHPIRYNISIQDWWSLLNNAGYKLLLDQLTPKQLQQFKSEHLEEIKALSIDGLIELNADTLFSKVIV